MNYRETSVVDGFKERAPLGYALFEVTKLMKRRFEDEAKAHGVTLPQWRVLAQVAGTDGMPQKAIAEAIDADQMTVSGMLDRLEKRDLVSRVVDPSDSRAKLVRVTDAGLDVVRSARAVGTAMYESALAGVPPEDAAIAMRLLTRMRANLLGQPAEPEENPK